MMPSRTFSEAVRLARTLSSELLVAVHPQKVVYPAKFVVDAKGTTKEVQASLLCAYVDPVPGLIKKVEKLLKVTVVVKTMDLCSCVTGLSFLHDDQPILEVRVQKSASYCVKRFAVLKELLHYVKPELSSSLTTEDSLSHSIMSAMCCRVPFPSIEAEFHPEAFCYYCAIEMTLWWGKNGAERRRLIEMHQNSSVTHEVMAVAYRAPLFVIQFFFEESYYSELSFAVNSHMELG